MRVDLLNDLSTLTTISKTTLEKLCTKAEYAICNSVDDCVSSENDFLEIDLGIGFLVLKIAGNSIQYRFVPSKSLETNIKNVIINGENILECKLDESLLNKITNVYKEYL